jgi:hypothetical protein
MDETTPLFGSSNGAEEALVPAYTLAFYWPCLVAGVLANTLAVVASLEITKSILDVPARASFFQTHWFIVWLVGLLLLSGARGPRRGPCCMPTPARSPLAPLGLTARARLRIVALPVYIFTAVMLNVARGLLGPRGAFPSWVGMIVASCANGCVFYGLFNATYPFSFFLQVQVYSVCAAFGLCAYALLACVTRCVPCLGGFNPFAAWLVCGASAVAALTHMDAIFAYLGYPESRTPGNGLWHPWVAFVLQTLFLSNGVIQNVVGTAEAARFFEPGQPRAPAAW